MSQRRTDSSKKERGGRGKRSDRVALWTLRCLILRRVYAEMVGRRSRWEDSVLVTAGLDTNAEEEIDAVTLGRRIRGRLTWLDRSGIDETTDIEKNLDVLAEVMGLDPIGRDVLSLCVHVHMEYGLRRCLELQLESRRCGLPELASVIAAVLDAKADEVRDALGLHGPLLRSGLLTLDMAFGMMDWPVNVAPAVQDALTGEATEREELLSRLITKAPPPTLTRDDFPHLAADLQLLLPYLDRAIREGWTGVNVLLYGAPGTGKTETARLLAASLDVPLYQVLDEIESTGSSDRPSRFRSYLLTQELLRARGGALVMFDEIEDVFTHSLSGLLGEGAAVREKAWTNRLLENNPLPAVWITNSVRFMDPAVLRRYDLVVEFRTPPASVRRTILERSLKGLPVREEWLDRMADDPRAVPSDIDSAAKVLAAIDGQDARATEKSYERLIDTRLAVRRMPRRRRRGSRFQGFDLDLLNCPVDIKKLVGQLERHKQASLCFHGAPGSGKTALAHHLARCLDRPLMLRRASELLSCYVGETEANLARMFVEAEEDDAVLLLDEADSFLRDRRGARAVWEVTQVNELLVRMEEFEGLFVAATNLVDDLDQAAFRRFGVKVRFDPLTLEQRRTMLRRIAGNLGLPVDEGAEAYLDHLSGLTPGDFAAVRKRASLLEPASVQELVGLLEEDLALRLPTDKVVGFGGVGSR